MKTTFDLRDELMRAIRLRAARENKTLEDVVVELLRTGLAADQVGSPVSARVRLPLVLCAHEAPPADELTPERAALLLEDEEARGAGYR